MPVHIKTVTGSILSIRICIYALLVPLCVGITLVAPSFAAPLGDTSVDSGFTRTLDAIVKKSPAPTVSAIVLDKISGQVEYSSNAKELLPPASVLKIVTSTVALDQLGVDFSFSTKIFFKASSDKQSLASMVILGGGDPTLTTEKIYAVVTSLKKRGIKTIQELGVDNSKFLETRVAAGTRAYQAAPSPIAINYNSEEIVSCQGGHLDASHCTSRFESVADSDTAFINGWRAELQHAGIEVKKIRSEPVTLRSSKDDYQLLYDVRSDPLPKILFDLNHFSTNIIADSLVFQLGCESGQSPFVACSFERGLAKIQSWLKSNDIDDVTLHDGCGLSAKNQISASDLGHVIYKAMATPTIAPELLASFSIANQTGTLKSRNFSSEVLFRGKTGSLDGVITLAGIVRSARGKEKIIVLLLHGVSDVQKAKSWEESFVDAVYR